MRIYIYIYHGAEGRREALLHHTSQPITQSIFTNFINHHSNMAVFLTGGTGKTSIRIAPLLQDANIPFVLGSRRGASAAPSGTDAVKFDWLDDSTFPNPFEHKFPTGKTISAVYLIAPEVEEPAPSMNAFVDYAIKEHGVKRFVLLGGTSAKPGGRHVGKVWQHLLDIGVDYAVLNPSWFMGMQNIPLHT